MESGAGSYRRFLAGEEDAFDEIWKAYRDSLTFFINRFVHDMSTAEDLAIDTFVQLIVHRRRYHFQVTLKTYLFMIGRSRALDYLKHRNKLTIVELSSAEAETVEDGFLENTVLADERANAVNRALDTLPEEMRIAVHLVYFEELSYEEAAKVMKKSRKQIDNLLYRAKTLLRSSLGKEGEFLR